MLRSSRLRPFTSLVLAASSLALLAGCASSPFQTSDVERGVRVSRDRLEAVERFEIGMYAVGAQAEDSDALAEPVDPFLGMDEVPVSLEQARAWTLQNNLDLQVTLVNPTIANSRLAQEEAAWEWAFFANARLTNTDQPTASTLSGNQVENQNADFGVRIPLRTGGTITARLPLNRTETDNAFSVLNPSATADIVVSLSQPLLRGAGNRANTHGLRIQALETQISEANTKLEVIRQLANADRAYWSVYAAQESLRVAYEQYQLADEQLSAARRRYNARVVPEIEIVRAEEGVAQRILSIITAQNDYRRTQRALKRVLNVDGLGLHSETLILLATEPDPVKYAIDAQHMVDAALDQRMELLELELRLAQDYSTIDFQKNQALPLATFDYTYRSNGLGSTNNGAFAQARRFDFEDHSVGINFEIPLGNEVAESRVHQAILSRLQRLATRAAREQSITQEVLERSKGYFQLKEGSLYPALHRLERERLLESYWEQAESGRRRKYYRITPAGKKTLEVKRDDWEEFTVGVNGVLGASANVVA